MNVGGLLRMMWAPVQVEGDRTRIVEMPILNQ